MFQSKNCSQPAKPAHEMNIAEQATTRRIKKTLRYNPSPSTLGQRYMIAKKVNRSLKLTIKKNLAK